MLKCHVGKPIYLGESSCYSLPQNMHSRKNWTDVSKILYIHVHCLHAYMCHYCNSKSLYFSMFTLCIAIHSTGFRVFVLS